MFVTKTRHTLPHEKWQLSYQYTRNITSDIELRPRQEKQLAALHFYS